MPSLPFRTNENNVNLVVPHDDVDIIVVIIKIKAKWLDIVCRQHQCYWNLGKWIDLGYYHRIPSHMLDWFLEILQYLMSILKEP